MSIFGCKLSSIDIRDYKFNKECMRSNIPESFICKNLPVVKNQGNVSSCVAHATSSILEYYDKNQKTLSTNFIYGLQKKLFKDTTPGMSLRQACEIAAKYGDMTEADCPGNDEVPECFGYAEESLSSVIKKSTAYQYRITNYVKLSSIKEIQYSLMNYGPVLCSIKWHDNFKCLSGVLVGNRASKKYSNHAIIIYGWDSTYLYCQNSWGTNWGNKGRFKITKTTFEKVFNEAYCLVDYDNTNDIKKTSLNKCVAKTINNVVNTVYSFIQKLK